MVGNQCPAKTEHGGGYGFCLEPQFYPTAIHVEKFLSPVLAANTTAEHFVKYHFGFLSEK